jgi:hypothetical protein
VNIASIGTYRKFFTSSKPLEIDAGNLG